MATHRVEVLSQEDWQTWRTDTTGRPGRCEQRWAELDARHEVTRVVAGVDRLVIDTDGRRA